jgi:hypothetical protein
MSVLGNLVISFVEKAKLSPVEASDPGVLAKLERVAREAFEGAFVALHAPIAPETYEAQGLLLASVDQSGSVPIAFERPVEIVGFRPSVSPRTPEASAPPTIAQPTLEDILVSVNINKKTQVTTSQQAAVLTTAGTTEQFVTLASIGVQVPRLVGFKLRFPQPQIDFIFRWKAGANAWDDAADTLVSVAVYARFL